MRLTFLGTSAGMPTTERNVTALALALDDSRDWYLVDCGEGTQQRLLRCRYTLSGLKTIFITHVHGDHMFGLPGLITSASMQGRQEPLTICAPEGVESFVRHSLACAAVTELPFELEFRRTDMDGFQLDDDHVTVTSHALSHRVPSYGFRFTEKPGSRHLDTDKLEQLQVPKGPLWGELQHGNSVTLEDGSIIEPADVTLPAAVGRVVVVAGDNDQPELLHDAMQGANLLVHEATFTDEVYQKVGPKYMHSTARMVGEAAERAGIAHVILTHFSGRFRLSPHAGESSVEVLRREAQQFYSGNVELAEDYGCWELNRERQLRRV
ncbi:MAG: ribonuclease Z [Endozoicomonas sp.]